MSVSTETKSIGRITQIIGPVLDIVFSKGNVPNIYNALTITSKNGGNLTTQPQIKCNVPNN